MKQYFDFGLVALAMVFGFGLFGSMCENQNMRYKFEHRVESGKAFELGSTFYTCRPVEIK